MHEKKRIISVGTTHILEEQGKAQLKRQLSKYTPKFLASLLPVEMC